MTLAYSARQLAALNLPNWPSTKFGIAKLARREGWSYLPSSRGAMLFDVASLPEWRQQQIARATAVHASQLEGEVRGSTRFPELAAKPAALRNTGIERARILREAQERIEHGMPIMEAYELAARESGETPRTIFRWAKRVRGCPVGEWPALLVPAYKSASSLAPIHADAWNAFLSDYHRPSRPAFQACYDRLVALAVKHPEWGPLPSVDSLARRYRREVPRQTTIIRRDGAEAFEKALPAQQREKSMLRALDWVNSDGHRCDVFVAWPSATGEPAIVRPILVAWQDVYSGKILSWRIDVTENEDVVRLAFADMVRDWGIPRKATVDNGHAFAGKRMTGGYLGRHRFAWRPEEPEGIYKAFGLEMHFSKPYNGRAKPIERAWRDLVERVAKHPICQGAYTGNKVSAKPEDYRSHAVALETLVELVRTEVETHNAHAGRESPVCRGRSFDETFLASYRDPSNVIRRATAEQIEHLMLPVDNVYVRKDVACIHFLGNRFHAPELVALRGQTVSVRFDPMRVHDGLLVFRPGELRPVCRAACIAPVGFGSTDAARRDARARAALVKAEKARAAALGTIPAHQLGAEMLGLAKPTKRPSPKVIEARFGRTAPAPATGTAPTKTLSAAERERIAHEEILALGAIARELQPRRIAEGE
jgi:putative transposase